MSNKYHAKKVTYYGETFDSQKEAMRWLKLRNMEQDGKISRLRRQVTYELIPAQYIDGKLVERPVKYVADFVYIDENGQEVVEDAKGVRTPDYIIKRKLMLWYGNIRIREV